MNRELPKTPQIWVDGRKDIMLTILGRPVGSYGERIVKRCQRLKGRGFNIQFYDKFIPEVVYQKMAMSADVLINPIRSLNYIHSGFTAGLVEAIRHAKPGIYPVGYVVPEEVLSSSLFYNDIEELPGLIECKFLDNRGFLETISRNAMANSEKYSLEKVADYFKSTVLDS